jgi:hypothetical protein
MRDAACCSVRTTANRSLDQSTVVYLCGNTTVLKLTADTVYYCWDHLRPLLVGKPPQPKATNE